ncbi:MAG: DUF6557 family protein [Gemmatimonadales bacterium]
MTLAELVRATEWVEVQAALTGLFPEERSRVSDYQGVFRTLRAMEPEANLMRISIEVRPVQGCQDDPVPEVFGRNGTLNRELADCPVSELEAEYGLTETAYSLSLQPWRNWLGTMIEPGTLGAYSHGQIIAYVIVDMTFHGFSEAENQAVLEELQRRMAEIDIKTDGGESET